MTRVITILGPTILLLGLGADLPALFWLAMATVTAGMGRPAAATTRTVWVRLGEVVPAAGLGLLLIGAVLPVSWRAAPLPAGQPGLTADTAARLLVADLGLWLGLVLLLVVTLLAGRRNAKDRP